MKPETMQSGSLSESNQTQGTEPGLRYRHLVQNSVDAIVSIDADSVVTLWNPAAEKIFGFTASEALGRKITDLIVPPEIRPMHLQGMYRRLETGEGPLLGKTIRVTALRKDGSRFPVEVSLFQTEAEGTICFTAIMRDTTSHQLIHDELLEQADQARVRERIVRQLSNAIRGKKNLHEILELAVDDLGEFTRSDHCILWLVDPETGEYQLPEYEYRSKAFISRIRDVSCPSRPLFSGVLPDREVAQISDVGRFESASPLDAELVRERGVKSLLQIPLIHEDTFIGLLRFHAIEAYRHWDDDTISLAKEIGANVAMAVSGLRREEQTERELHQRVRQQEVVNRFSQSALSGMLLDELFDLAARMIADTLEVPYCKIVERIASPSPSSDEFLIRFRSVVGWEPEMRGKAFDMNSEPHSAYTLQAGHPVVVRDLLSETRFKPSPVLYQHGIRSGAAVVILTGRGAFGVLEVDTDKPRVFRDFEVDFLQGMANVMGIVIERKMVEREAGEAKERYNMVLDASKDGLWSWNIDSGEVSWSDRLYEMYGMRREDFNPNLQSAFELFHPEDRVMLEQLVKDHLEKNVPYEAEFRKKHASGGYRYFYTKGEAVRDAFGKPVRMVGLVTDISARKETEAALRASEAMLRRIVESSHIGILFAQRDGQVNDANNAFLNMVGYSREELEAGKISWFSLTPPEFAVLDAEKWREVLETGECVPFEKQYVHKSGRRIDILLGAALLDGPEPVCIAYALDITDRKRAERKMEEGLARESLSRRILEITSQSMDIEFILKSVAEEVGKFFKVDRCILVRYENMSDESQDLQVTLSGQYCSSPEWAEANLSDIPRDMLEILTRNLPRHQALKLINAPTPEAYIADLQERFAETPFSKEQRQEFVHFAKVLLFERYQVQSNLRVGITYKGKGYGAITLHQCDHQRVWTQQEIELLYNIAYHIGSALYQMELYQHEQQARRDLERSYNLMNIVREAQSHFITNENIYSLFEEPLNKLLAHTQSEYGFIGEILKTEEGRPYLKCNFLTNIAWNEETRRLYEENKSTGFEFHKLDNLFGEVIKTGQVVISNDPANDARSAGRPFGHPDLRAFLGMPFYSGEQLVGMVGIANRPGGYDEELVEELQPFLQACGNIIVGSRNEKQRQKLTHDLKVNERALKIYATRLEKSNKELEQFATIASHDLQAPLRKVILFSEYLRVTNEDKLSPESKDYIERIQKATGRMQNLITDLLVLSRVTRKGKPFKPVDLNETAREVISDLEESIRETGARVEIGPMMNIEADDTQMRQMLMNLIANAIKFNRPGEQPVVKVSAKALNNQTCQILVEDNGIGFDEKYLDRIFDVFERLHADHEYEGTGMGLAIVQKIAERHGGMVTAKSHPNQGATFIVTLPIRHH